MISRCGKFVQDSELHRQPMKIYECWCDVLLFIIKSSFLYKSIVKMSVCIYLLCDGLYSTRIELDRGTGTEKQLVDTVDHAKVENAVLWEYFYYLRTAMIH